jgi:DNA topoisomerase-1
LDFAIRLNAREVELARFEWPERIEFVDSTSETGLGRQRRGRGFAYTTAEGRRVTDGRTIARIAALAIPPAWTGVWIAPSVHAHVQATGRDKRRRKQYRYHPVWQLRRQKANYNRLVEFARALPAIRSFIDAGLRRPQLDKERVLALALRLLDSGMIRVGNDEYAKTNGSRGLTTLGKRNVAIRGNEVKFHFVGKGGVDYDLAINDPRAARALRRCHELPGQRLFRYVDEAGETHPITSGDVNAQLEELTGQKFTAKDFRTWTGTAHTFAQLAARTPGDSETATAQIVNEVARATALVLGNTLAVCKRHYVHPRVLEAFAAGKLARIQIGKRKSRGLSAAEAALARFLESH